MIDIYILISVLLRYSMLHVAPTVAVRPDTTLSAQPAAAASTVSTQIDTACSEPVAFVDSTLLAPALPSHPEGDLYDYLDPRSSLDRLITEALGATDLPEDAFNDTPVVPVAYAVPEEATKLHKYMTTLSHTFDKRIQRALLGVNTLPSRLLAMKYYLRHLGNINAAWAWTRREVEQYKRSIDYRKALAEVEQIRKTFAEQNPGYTLRVNTEIRSLASQVAIWNDAPSVDFSGRALYRDAIRTLADSSFNDSLTHESLSRFRQFLLSSAVPAAPTAAVPGFSQHGQLRAFDFIIWAGDTAIAAGADAGSAYAVWDNSGWSDKLKQAITDVSSDFEGPLAAPHEPWHYAYVE